MSFLKGLFGKNTSNTEKKTNVTSSTEDRDALPDDIHEQIVTLSANGDRLAEAEDYNAAIASYKSAWNLLPEPKNHWNASTWLVAALADAHFFLGDNVAILETLEFGMTCPDAIGNPFLHLRIGQAHFNMGNKDKAADELMRAYMGGGPEFFNSEDDCYLGFLKTRANIDDENEFS